MIDIIRGEGAAKCKDVSDWLPIGMDALAVARKRAVNSFAVCNEVAEMVGSNAMSMIQYDVFGL